MTIRELINTSLMSGAEIIVGTDNLDWEVTGYTPENFIESGRWMNPGLIIICDEQPITHLDEIITSYASSVFLFGENALSLIDDHIRSRLDDALIPIIRMPRNLSPLNFTKRFSLLSTQNYSIEQHRTEWLSYICSSNYAPVHEQTAQAYGYNPSYSYVNIILKLQNPFSIPFRNELKLQDAKNILTRTLSYQNAPLLSYLWLEDNKLVCMMPCPAQITDIEMRTHIEKGITTLYTVLFDCKWYIYVGTKVTFLSEFHHSYTCALQTETILNAFHSHESINYYDDWYIHILLLTQPRSELIKQCEHYLSPILDKPEMLESLNNYLNYSENIKETATKTYIHVNTLRYRIQKISELLHCDLNIPATRYRLRSALIIYQYLTNTGEKI